MKTLIVGGTGLVGAETARLMASKGHDVTLMSRSPTSSPALAEFPHIAHDYLKDDISIETLNDFDWLVFSAAADIRMLPEGESDETFFMHAASCLRHIFHKLSQLHQKHPIWCSQHAYE